VRYPERMDRVVSLLVLIFQSLGGPPRRIPPSRDLREGAISEGAIYRRPPMSAASYISIASAISTEPPDPRSGQAFALAAASS
jgi:hypothetical protein